MSVRSFHSVFMATAVAGAALGCYLVSLRVASERAALEAVESHIVRTQADIRLLQTEIGTRGRLAQLERWNVRVLSLSAPSADQILGDKFQLARLVQPEHHLPVDAPMVLASAPAPQAPQPLAQDVAEVSNAAPVPSLLHQASLKVAERPTAAAPKPSEPVKKAETDAVASLKPMPFKAVAAKPESGGKKAGDKSRNAAAQPVTRPLRTANVDPLAPLPSQHSTAKGSRTQK